MRTRETPAHREHDRSIRRGPFRGLNPVVTTAVSLLVGVWLVLGAFWTGAADQVLAAARNAVGPTLEWYSVALVTFVLAVIV